MRLLDLHFIAMLGTIFQFIPLPMLWYWHCPEDWGEKTKDFTLPVVFGIVMGVTLLVQVVATYGIFFISSSALILRLKGLRRSMALDIRRAILTLDEETAANSASSTKLHYDNVNKSSSSSSELYPTEFETDTPARLNARNTFHFYIAEYQRIKTQVDNFAEGTQYYYFIAEFLILLVLLASMFDIFKNPDG